MSYLLEVPVSPDGGAVVVFEVDRQVIPDGWDLVLASNDPGKAATWAKRSLEEVMSDLGPSLARVLESLKSLSPQEATIEFGLKVGGETGLIVARGTAEANFSVKLTWNSLG